jgi:hypothetical protein
MKSLPKSKNCKRVNQIVICVRSVLKPSIYASRRTSGDDEWRGGAPVLRELQGMGHPPLPPSGGARDVGAQSTCCIVLRFIFNIFCGCVSSCSDVFFDISWVWSL